MRRLLLGALAAFVLGGAAHAAPFKFKDITANTTGAQAAAMPGAKCEAVPKGTAGIPDGSTFCDFDPTKFGTVADQRVIYAAAMFYPDGLFLMRVETADDLTTMTMVNLTLNERYGQPCVGQITSGLKYYCFDEGRLAGYKDRVDGMGVYRLEYTRNDGFKPDAFDPPKPKPSDF